MPNRLLNILGFGVLLVSPWLISKDTSFRAADYNYHSQRYFIIPQGLRLPVTRRDELKTTRKNKDNYLHNQRANDYVSGIFRKLS